MNEYSTRAATLTARALSAAAARRETGEADGPWRDPVWAARARHAARHLADLLGIEYRDIQVSVNPCPARTGVPWIDLAVDNGADGYAFTIPYERPERILALAPCPDCARPVPTRLVTQLADLGQLVKDLVENPPAPGGFYRDTYRVAPEFDCTEHDPDCPNHLLNTLYPTGSEPRATAHRPAGTGRAGHGEAR